MIPPRKTNKSKTRRTKYESYPIRDRLPAEHRFRKILHRIVIAPREKENAREKRRDSERCLRPKRGIRKYFFAKGGESGTKGGQGFLKS